MIYLLAVVLTVSLLWVIYLVGSKLNFRNVHSTHVPITLSDISTILSTVISIVSLLVALWSVSIAIQQLNDAKTGSEEQANILKKQQVALDKSREALEAVNKTATEQQVLLNRSLAVSVKQFEILNSQWQDQQRRLAQKPKFEVRCQYTFRVTSLKLRDGTILSGDGTGDISDLFTEKQITANPFIMKLSNTFPEPEGYWGAGYFDLKINIKNTGEVNAENVTILITPLVYGLHLTGKTPEDSLDAFGAMVDAKGEPILSPAIVHRTHLAVFKKTNDEINIPMKVTFITDVIDRETPINISVYSQNSPIHTVPLKFKIATK